MDKQIDKLRLDEHYYGEFGKQYLSNSDISALLAGDPLKFKNFGPKKTAFLVGGYFHTAILEPHKLKDIKIADVPSRRVKAYKEIGEMCLLKHEAEKTDQLVLSMLGNSACYTLIREGDVLYEEPGISDINGLPWKGKADIINKTAGYVVDLKTTRDLNQFEDSITNYNYDSQAYIYEHLFGLPLMFLAIDKRTHKVKDFVPTQKQLQSGRDKVERASEVYKQWFPNKDYD